MTSDQVRAGTKVVMSHAERQAFLKASPFGQLLGVAHLLPEVGKAKDAALKARPVSHRISRRSKTRYRFAIKNNLELSRRHPLTEKALVIVRQWLKPLSHS
ncbi:MAG TPA: hypothetical protein V6D33_18270 [Cyanophyceae cyanobacterium]